MTDTTPEDAPPGVDTSRPHAARMYDYFIGGKNHFAADRETAEKMLEAAPGARTGARENRAFLGRAVRYLAEEAGIRQFLDIGTGLPATGSVHEVAQAIDPAARVVYCDNDPLVLAHARALLTSAPEGCTSYIQADLRDPETILAEARKTLDFSQPIALILAAVLHFIPDEDDPARILATLLGALPSGSYLVASHSTAEHAPPEKRDAGESAYRGGGVTLRLRDHADFADLAFTGLRLVEPGVVLVSEWRPKDKGPRPPASEVATYGAVARKPLRVAGSEVLEADDLGQAEPVGVRARGVGGVHDDPPLSASPAAQLAQHAAAPASPDPDRRQRGEEDPAARRPLRDCSTCRALASPAT